NPSNPKVACYPFKYGLATFSWLLKYSSLGTRDKRTSNFAFFSFFWRQMKKFSARGSLHR
ncbi:MAG: hypothetical protein KJ630_19915, partial [Proteobacteria bacterium]|nr:hypothetical protein [Pseudomonadota bacterium]